MKLLKSSQKLSLLYPKDQIKTYFCSILKSTSYTETQSEKMTRSEEVE